MISQILKVASTVGADKFIKSALEANPNSIASKIAVNEGVLTSNESKTDCGCKGGNPSNDPAISASAQLDGLPIPYAGGKVVRFKDLELVTNGVHLQVIENDIDENSGSAAFTKHVLNEATTTNDGGVYEVYLVNTEAATPLTNVTNLSYAPVSPIEGTDAATLLADWTSSNYKPNDEVGGSFDHATVYVGFLIDNEESTTFMSFAKEYLEQAECSIIYKVKTIVFPFISLNNIHVGGDQFTTVEQVQ